MKLSRCIASLSLSLLSILAASAQTFPSKSIKIVVPFGAGGVADLTARTVAQNSVNPWGNPS